MKFVIIFFIAVSISLSGFSQTLNSLGKIKVKELPQIPDHRVIKNGKNFKILTDSLSFDGNSYKNIPNGFITSLITVDNTKDYIKHYDINGKLIATILSDRIINLKISENGKYLAFNNTENIIYVNLSNYHIDTLSGSYVYTFVGNNKLMYYDAKCKVVFYDGLKINIQDYPNQFIEYKKQLYVITKYSIFELSGSSLIEKYKFKGKFFDAKIINQDFYFVDKIEKRKKEGFTLYKTSDFNKVIIVDKKDELNR